MEVNAVQPSKASASISVTDNGIFIEVKPVQNWKAHVPIEVTVEGILKAVNPEQLEKAQFPIEVTDTGIEIEVILREGNTLINAPHGMAFAG